LKTETIGSIYDIFSHPNNSYYSQEDQKNR